MSFLRAATRTVSTHSRHDDGCQDPSIYTAGELVTNTTHVANLLNISACVL